MGEETSIQMRWSFALYSELIVIVLVTFATVIRKHKIWNSGEYSSLSQYWNPNAHPPSIFATTNRGNSLMTILSSSHLTTITSSSFMYSKIYDFEEWCNNVERIMHQIDSVSQFLRRSMTFDLIVINGDNVEYNGIYAIKCPESYSKRTPAYFFAFKSSLHSFFCNEWTNGCKYLLFDVRERAMNGNAIVVKSVCNRGKCVENEEMTER